MSLTSLIGGAFRTRTEPNHDARPRSRRRKFRPSIDGLEGRELKDGGISLIAGTIQIAGTVADDSVIVSYRDPSHNIVEVTWNNTTVDFQRSDVTGIRFDGQDGFNLFENLTDISSTATGNDGTNIFVGASGNDTFIGGGGFNYFWVTPGGHNTLSGGNGINIFLGVGSSDSVTVGSGYNLVLRSS